METVGVEPTPPRCKRGALPPELHPQGADGWSRTTTARGTAFTERRAHLVLSVRMKRVADRIRTDAAGITTPGAAVTPQPPCTTGATGFEPAPSRLTSERSALFELRPQVARVGFEPTVSSS